MWGLFDPAPPRKEDLEIFIKFLKNPDTEISYTALDCLNGVLFPTKRGKRTIKTPSECIKYMEDNMEKLTEYPESKAKSPDNPSGKR